MWLVTSVMIEGARAKRESWAIGVVLALGCGGHSSSRGQPAGSGHEAEGGANAVSTGTGDEVSSAGFGGRDANAGDSGIGGSSTSGSSGGGTGGGAAGSGTESVSGAGAGTVGSRAGATGAGASAGGASAGMAGAASGAGGRAVLPPPVRRSCVQATDCVIPETEPPGCAGAFCEFQACVYYTALDEDGDTDPAIGCISRDPQIEIPQGRDCNDHDARVSSVQDEICNGLDDNCDGLTDFQYGTAYTKPPAPFSTLQCLDGSWWVTSWHYEAYVTPPAADPLGPVTITKTELFVAPGNNPPVIVPNDLFLIERDATDAQGDHVVVDMNLDVLAGMSKADQTRVADVFAKSGILSFEVTVEPWEGIGLGIPTTGAPFRIK